MSVEITGIEKKSCSAKAGIIKGDRLVSINGNEIEDVLDYMFYAAEANVTLRIERGSETSDIRVKKSEYDDLGLEFQTFLMDSKRSCSNKCVFCFIDQMPKGMRETLYFKDDDARLSFLQGNYVTLTNLNQHDIDRIIKMHLNMNVSVHTTNPELRCKMMNNRFAGEKLDFLYQLADAGIMLNCQIVCCPGLNDGDELIRTMTDLEKISDSIQSVAVVPVGLTKFRDGLYPLRVFTKEEASATIDTIEKYNSIFKEKHGTGLVFASDEFYITAQRDFPDAEYYEDYPQYENGVGIVRSMIDEFEAALEDCDEKLAEKREISTVSGMLAAPYISTLSRRAEEKFPLLRVNNYAVRNEFFGENITVSGLITGGDIINQLSDQNLGSELLIPKVMLNASNEVFLDDYTLDEVTQRLGVSPRIVKNDGAELLYALLGTENGG